MQSPQPKSGPRRYARAPLAAAILLLSSSVMAQQAGQIEEVVVTAQKRAQNLQDVPISLQALGGEALDELNIQNFKEYVQMLPSVTMTPGLGSGSGFAQVYMRGIATGGSGQAHGSQPSVGMYLDEQTLTTVQGNLDVHLFDIARVEALAGPQGTLYGASSQAGTIRIVTNKPDASEFSAGYAVEGNQVDGDDTGYVVEGYVNVPINDNMAIRLVGWNKHDAGYVDNVLGTRTFPGDASTTADDITISNAEHAEDNYNTIDTIGARVALQIDLNESWTVTPSAMWQKQEGEGYWGDDQSDFVAGDNAVTHFQDEYSNDEWTMLSLLVEGKIGNFDVTYSGSYLDRDVDGSFDYSDYSYWYDTIYTTGYFASLHFDNAGSRIAPDARVLGDDSYRKVSHELRISSPQENRVRGMLGVFIQEQTHTMDQRFQVEGLADSMQANQDEPDGAQFPDTVYMNHIERIDNDKAIFGNISVDLTDSIEMTLGARFFKAEVTADGFYGYGQGFNAVWSGTGEAQCESQEQYRGGPCHNVDKGISETEQVYRANLTWQLDDDKMVYATWSEGYRPGGINRSPAAGEYVSDFLTNWEAGWKTEWMGNSLQFNGAVFFEEWDDFQVAVLGDNAIRQVDNGPTAEVIGLETQIMWLPTANLKLTTSMAFYDTELQDEYCAGCNADGSAWAPAGTELPVTAEFKGNFIARYSFIFADLDAYAQGAVSYEGSRSSSLRVADNDVRGDVPSNTIVDLSIGFVNEGYAVDLFIANVLDEDAPLFLTSQCNTSTCGAQNYAVRVRPRTVGIKFSQEF